MNAWRILGRAILPAIILVSPATAGAGEITFPGYEWQQVVAGVYVHSRTDPLAGPVDGNSVVVFGTSGVVVVDTHVNPAASRAVISQIKRITDSSVIGVVNTHWHDDHTNGNFEYRSAFPHAKIIAHTSTAAMLRTDWQRMIENRKSAYKSLTPEQVLEAADQLTDVALATEYRIFAGYVAALSPELPGLELAYPDTVIEDHLQLELGNRRVVIEWLGPGNTDGDIVVWLPDDKVLVTGDILVAPVPFAFKAPMLKWMDTLTKVAGKGADIIVPGHGPVQHDLKYLNSVHNLLARTVEAVRDARKSGVAYAELRTEISLDDVREQFTLGNAQLEHAWRSNYFEPALESTWRSLEYPFPPSKSDEQ